MSYETIVLRTRWALPRLVCVQWIARERFPQENRLIGSGCVEEMFSVVAIVRIHFEYTLRNDDRVKI